MSELCTISAAAGPRAVLFLLLGLTGLAGADAAAGDGGARSPQTLYDYATVVSVREVWQNGTRPRSACRAGTAPGAPAPAMGAPRRQGVHSIVEALLAELPPRPAQRCEALESVTPDAFEVTYRYRGRLYERRLTHRPGERLRVRVQFTPGPAGDD